MGTGQNLWKKAKKLIPGGNMLLSKRSEMFLPEIWPSYFSKSKDIYVWDLDNVKYTDMCIMGIGTNTLGYGNEEVDNSVRNSINAGNMSTFNCPEEVYLAERLIEIHDWADMVRFARSGGEANAIAIRIARAASGKDNIAICGYHGWHDWYLSANLSSNSNLDGHLLPGLSPKGVPRVLEGTVHPFKYNDLEKLKSLIKTKDIGVIKMEVARNMEPSKNFVQSVRDLATEHNIVLIFDECTSGFRETFGGLHKKFNVSPDICMFGKALGNGYAVTSIIGKREIMESAQSTFISSTFWTERIGSVAALTTLKVMEEEKSWETISKKGKFIKKNWLRLAKNHGLEISIGGLSAIPNFSFKYKNNISYKTFISQEMLKKGFLSSNVIFVCTKHTDSAISKYFDLLDTIFYKIKKSEDKGNINELLDGPIAHSGFNRLN